MRAEKVVSREKTGQICLVCGVVALAAFAIFTSCRGIKDSHGARQGAYVIAFSSCLQQDGDTGIWDKINAQKPHLFLFAGDTVYADTYDMEAKRQAFAKLNADPRYREFKKNTRVIAVWDDHDFGLNDAGGNYAKKAEMQTIFLDAFDEPKDSPRRTQQGIYTAEEINVSGKIVQIIVLDVRYSRSPWVPGSEAKPFAQTYLADNRSTATMLGETQWKWLSEKIRRPADLRLLVSSTPVLSDDYKGERWGAFPKERDRLFKAMTSAKSGKWAIITGDRHFAQVLVRRDVLDYPLIELTASGMNTVWPEGSKVADRYRDGEALADYNFGVLYINGETGRMDFTLNDGEGKIWRSGGMDFN